MLIGWFLIFIGIVFAVFGIGGGAKVSVGGRGGFTFVVTGAAGIVLIVAGALVVAMPDF